MIILGLTSVTFYLLWAVPSVRAVTRVAAVASVTVGLAFSFAAAETGEEEADETATVFVHHTGAPDETGPRLSRYLAAIIDADLVRKQSVRVSSGKDPVVALQELAILPPGRIETEVVDALCQLNNDQCTVGVRSQCGDAHCWEPIEEGRRIIKAPVMSFYSNEVVRFRHVNTAEQSPLEMTYGDGGCRDTRGPFPQETCSRLLSRLNGEQAMALATIEKRVFWLDIPSTENTLQLGLWRDDQDAAMALVRAIAEEDSSAGRPISISSPLRLKPFAQTGAAAVSGLGPESNLEYLQAMNFDPARWKRDAPDSKELVGVFDYFPWGDAGLDSIASFQETCLLHSGVISFPINLSRQSSSGTSDDDGTVGDSGSSDTSKLGKFLPDFELRGMNSDNDQSGSSVLDPCNLPAEIPMLGESAAELHHGPLMASIIVGQPRSSFPGNKPKRFGAASSSRLVFMSYSETKPSPHLSLDQLASTSADDREKEMIRWFQRGGVIKIFNVSMGDESGADQSGYHHWNQKVSENALFVAGAGNDGERYANEDDCLVYPACWSVTDTEHWPGDRPQGERPRPSYLVLSVAGVRSGSFPADTNYGKAIDVSAIGHAVGQSLTQTLPETTGGLQWYRVSNSSPATAYVSGLAGELGARLYTVLKKAMRAETLNGIEVCRNKDDASKYFSRYKGLEGYRIRNRIVATADHRRDQAPDGSPTTQYGVVNFDRALNFKHDLVKLESESESAVRPLNFAGEWALHIRGGTINNVQTSLINRKDEWITPNPQRDDGSTTLIGLDRLLRLERTGFADGDPQYPRYRIVFIDDKTGAAVHIVNARIKWFRQDMPKEMSERAVRTDAPDYSLLRKAPTDTTLGDIIDMTPRWINFGCEIDYDN